MMTTSEPARRSILKGAVALGGLAAMPMVLTVSLTQAKTVSAADRGQTRCVSYEVRGPIAIIGLDSIGAGCRPNVDGYAALSVAYRRFEQDPSVRVAVLYGHGADFAIGGVGKGSLPDPATGKPAKPLIAAVHGETRGVGHGLLLAADVRIAVATALFTDAHELDPDGVAARVFKRDVGQANAMRYLLSGDAMSAHEAFRIGLVQDIAATRDEAFDAALALADRMVRCPTPDKIA